MHLNLLLFVREVCGLCTIYVSKKVTHTTDIRESAAFQWNQFKDVPDFTCVKESISKS